MFEYLSRKYYIKYRFLKLFIFILIVISLCCFDKINIDKQNKSNKLIFKDKSEIISNLSSYNSNIISKESFFSEEDLERFYLSKISPKEYSKLINPYFLNESYKQMAQEFTKESIQPFEKAKSLYFILKDNIIINKMFSDKDQYKDYIFKNAFLENRNYSFINEKSIFYMLLLRSLNINSFMVNIKIDDKLEYTQKTGCAFEIENKIYVVNMEENNFLANYACIEKINDIDVMSKFQSCFYAHLLSDKFMNWKNISLKESLDVINTCLKISPEDENAIHGKINILLTQNKIDEAVKFLESKKEKIKKNSLVLTDIYNKFASYYYSKDKYIDSINMCDYAYLNLKESLRFGRLNKQSIKECYINSIMYKILSYKKSGIDYKSETYMKELISSLNETHMNKEVYKSISLLFAYEELISESIIIAKDYTKINPEDDFSGELSEFLFNLEEYDSVIKFSKKLPEDYHFNKTKIFTMFSLLKNNKYKNAMNIFDSLIKKTLSLSDTELIVSNAKKMLDKSIYPQHMCYIIGKSYEITGNFKSSKYHYNYFLDNFDKKDEKIYRKIKDSMSSVYYLRHAQSN